MNVRNVTGLACVTFALLGACGDDEPARSSFQPVSGTYANLDASAQLSSLDPNQHSALCGAVVERVLGVLDSEVVQHGMCLQGAVFGTQLAPLVDVGEPAPSCEEAYDSCRGDYAATEDPCPDQQAVAGCSATLGEYQRCMEAALRQLHDGYGMLVGRTCSSTSLEDIDLGSVSLTPPECQAFEAKCPNLIRLNEEEDDSDWILVDGDDDFWTE